jgi:hypothetical protein
MDSLHEINNKVSIAIYNNVNAIAHHHCRSAVSPSSCVLTSAPTLRREIHDVVNAVMRNVFYPILSKTIAACKN